MELSARAWDAWTRGERDEADELSAAAVLALGCAGRRERQHVEVVRLAIAGQRTRARDLASEHLSEFPHDTLVQRVRDACASA